MAKRKPKTIATLAGIARHLGISETSVYGAKRRHDDFPKRHGDGYCVDEFETFAKRNEIWSHRQNASDHNGKGTLTAAKIKRLEVQTARDEIAKERELIEQAKELGELLFYDDVAKELTQTMGIVTHELDAAVDIVDRTLPSTISDDDRARVLAVVKRVRLNISTAVQQLVKGENDDS
jgi:hypothetical protein